MPARDTWPGGQCSCGSFPCQCEATARGSSSDPTSSGNLASGRAIDAEPKVNCICNRHVFEAYLSRATTSCGSSYYLDTALHVCMLSCFIGVQFLVTLWTIALRAPLSKGFSRQEYWSGLPCPPPADLPHPGIKPMSPAALELQAKFFFFTVEPPQKTGHYFASGTKPGLFHWNIFLINCK